MVVHAATAEEMGLGVSSLQFQGDWERREFLMRLSLEVWDGKPIFTTAELGAPVHFNARKLTGVPAGTRPIDALKIAHGDQQEIDSLLQDCADSGQPLGEVSAHARFMGLAAKLLDPEMHAPFIGESLMLNGDGSVDYSGTTEQTIAEYELHCRAMKLVGATIINVFAGSLSFALRQLQFPQMGDEQRARLRKEWIARYRKLLEIADKYDMEAVCVEQHAGEEILDPEEMADLWNEVKSDPLFAKLFRYKLDVSHWLMIGIVPADGMARLTELAPDVKLQIHYKGGRCRLNGVRSTKSSALLRNSRLVRPNQFVAVHLIDNAVAVWVDFCDALNSHPGQVSVKRFIEHEDDRMPALHKTDRRLRYNAVVAAGRFCIDHLMFPSGVDHQAGMHD